jgi:hypothetical protein
MKTQVDLVTSSDVLGATLAKHPELAALDALRGSTNPESTIRRLVQVEIRPDTDLITVAMSSGDPRESTLVVTGVVDAYLSAAKHWESNYSQQYIKRLQEEGRKLKAEIIKSLEIQSTRTGPETLDITFAKAEVERDKKLYMSIQDQIKQVQFDDAGPARVDMANHRIRVDPTTPNWKTPLMVAFPFADLGLLFTWFFLLEWRRAAAEGRWVEHAEPGGSAGGVEPPAS